MRRGGVLAAVLLAAGCGGMDAKPGGWGAPVTFGTLPGGEQAMLYALCNAHGMEARITDYGGIVTSLLVPDKAGKTADVVLGFDSLAPYLADNPYFGCIVGRYGNRIGQARFTLDGKAYALAANNGANHLHGGVSGFDKKLWRVVRAPKARDQSLALAYTSPDGEEGYPGRLDVTVTYTVTEANELAIDYEAVTDKPTIVNLTHHGYFNLGGHGSGLITGHRLRIRAEKFTPVDAGLIPTGELRPVEGTPFDFRDPVVIGMRIDADDAQLRNGKGYDHNFVLTRAGAGLEPAARVEDPASGRVMEVLTTEPGVQFYSGNFLDGHHVGKGGLRYARRSGLCLETQHYPDSPNRPAFPSVRLDPGRTYRSRTVYRFSAE